VHYLSRKRGNANGIAGFILVVVVSTILIIRLGSPLASVRVTSPTREPLFGIAVSRSAESTRLYAVGASGIVLVSTDEGRTWKRKAVTEGAPSSEDDLLNVGFSADGLSGWIVGEDGVIFHTTDGGKSWLPQRSRVQNRLFAVAALTPESACVVGSDGVLLHTDSGGKNWVSQTFKNIEYFGVVFTDQENGWAVGEFETILHTSDGGVTWDLRHGGKRSRTSPPYFAVAFSDARHGWVTGLAGSMLVTEDGGQHWSEQRLPVNDSLSLFSIAPIPGTNTIWAAGGRGSIFRLTLGQWKSQPSTTRSDLTGLVVVNGTLVAVGMDGTIIRDEGKY
jgi:photosystem II stability/assembly factor-like uncharacterized protein